INNPEDIVDLPVDVTIHSYEGLLSYSNIDKNVTAYIKVDCGLGRLGFPREEWDKAFKLASESSNLSIKGLYTHITSYEDEALFQHQLEFFKEAEKIAAKNDLKNLETMIS